MQADSQPKSNDARKLLAYVLAVLLGGAILAPWLQMGGQWLLTVLEDGEPGSGGWFADELRRASISRYFSRSGQFFAVVLLWPLIRWAGFNCALFPSARPWGAGLRDYGIGFAAAAGLLMVLGAVFVQTEVYQLREDAPWGKVGSALSAALGAGVLEELFFRGAILGLLMRSMAPLRAAFWCTFLFAFVHFLKPPEGWELDPQGATWAYGFQVLGSILGQFRDTHFLLAEFATLFAVGWVVALARLRTGQLWLAMGLHGGWIFGLKYFSAVTRSSAELKAGEFLPWIGVNLKIGLAPLIVIAITGWLVLRGRKAEG